MREQVLAAQSSDWREVITTQLLAPLQVEHQFVKHMSHHMVGDVKLDWLKNSDQRCVFLLRDPHEQLPSMQRDLGQIDMQDLGWSRHLEIFESVNNPVVVDSRDLLENPEGILAALCVALEIEFFPSMLKWKPGRHSSYGVWAPFWYENVEKSCGFSKWKAKSDDTPKDMQPLLEECDAIYQQMRAVRLGA